MTVKVNIAVVNHSTAATDAEIASYLPALQRQVSEHYAPVWGTDCVLSSVPANAAVPTGSWVMAILDNSDQAGALGYHDVTSGGLPLAKVFAATDKQYGGSLSVTMSHELLEMLGDPDINTCVSLYDSSGNMSLFAFENCDAVEADNLGYNIDNVLVSDFVYPSWFMQSPVSEDGGKYDYCGHVSKPLQILPGGYIGVWKPNGGWSQITGQLRQGDITSVAPVGSRRERRARGHHRWIPSTQV